MTASTWRPSGNLCSGDLAIWNRMPPDSRRAQPAMQMGDHVAKMIAADLAASRAAFPLLRQRRHGDHRPHGRGGQG